ncbi:MAG: ribosome silencing factor [Desulfuromonas sp.]|nr:MAG: ribosome silencing factor [Desulfuromonas sp.]
MQAKECALTAAHYALEKKGLDLRLLELSGLSSLTDFLLIVTGRSDRQVQAIAEAIRLGLKKDHQTFPLAVEGMNEGRWVLLDYGEVMIHVFQESVRHFYDLEGLWSEAPEVPVPGVEGE